MWKAGTTRAHEERGKRRWKDPDYRARMTAHLRQMGQLPHIREKRRATGERLANDPSYKKAQGEKSRQHWAEAGRRKRARWAKNIQRGLSKPEVRQAISEKSKQYWASHKAELEGLRQSVANSGNSAGGHGAKRSVGRPANEHLRRRVRELRATNPPTSWGRIKVVLDYEMGKKRSLSTYRDYAENSD
jgi:hypothetical protein